MSRKDYIRIAALLRRTRKEWDDSEGICEAVINGIAGDLARYFATVDPTFDSREFLTAAGLRPAPLTAKGRQSWRRRNRA